MNNKMLMCPQCSNPLIEMGHLFDENEWTMIYDRIQTFEGGNDEEMELRGIIIDKITAIRKITNEVRNDTESE